MTVMASDVKCGSDEARTGKRESGSVIPSSPESHGYLQLPSLGGGGEVYNSSSCLVNRKRQERRELGMPLRLGDLKGFI